MRARSPFVTPQRALYDPSLRPFDWRTARTIFLHREYPSLWRFFGHEYSGSQMDTDLALIATLGASKVYVNLDSLTDPAQVGAYAGEVYFPLSSPGATPLANLADFLQRCVNHHLTVDLNFWNYLGDFSQPETTYRAWLARIAAVVYTVPGHPVRTVYPYQEIGFPLPPISGWSAANQQKAAWLRQMIVACRDYFPDCAVAVSVLATDSHDGADGTRGLLEALQGTTLDYIGLHYWLNSTWDRVPGALRSCLSVSGLPVKIDQHSYDSQQGNIYSFGGIWSVAGAEAMQAFATGLALEASRQLDIPDPGYFMLHDSPTCGNWPTGRPGTASLNTTSVPNAASGTLAAGTWYGCYSFLFGSVETLASPAGSVVLSGGTTAFQFAAITPPDFATHVVYYVSQSVGSTTMKRHSIQALSITSGEPTAAAQPIYGPPTSSIAAPYPINAAGGTLAAGTYTVAEAWGNAQGWTRPSPAFNFTVTANQEIYLPPRQVPGYATKYGVWICSTVAPQTALQSISLQTGLTPGGLTAATTITSLTGAGSVAGMPSVVANSLIGTTSNVTASTLGGRYQHWAYAWKFNDGSYQVSPTQIADCGVAGQSFDVPALVIPANATDLFIYVNSTSFGSDGTLRCYAHQGSLTPGGNTTAVVVSALGANQPGVTEAMPEYGSGGGAFPPDSFVNVGGTGFNGHYINDEPLDQGLGLAHTTELQGAPQNLAQLKPAGTALQNIWANAQAPAPNYNLGFDTLVADGLGYGNLPANWIPYVTGAGVVGVAVSDTTVLGPNGGTASLRFDNVSNAGSFELYIPAPTKLLVPGSKWTLKADLQISGTLPPAFGGHNPAIAVSVVWYNAASISLAATTASLGAIQAWTTVTGSGAPVVVPAGVAFAIIAVIASNYNPAPSSWQCWVDNIQLIAS